MNSLQARMESSLSSLVKYLDKIQVLAAVSGPQCAIDKSAILDLSKGVKNLEDSYHRIKAATLSNNQAEVQQATKVFYGIHGLIRPEIIATFVTLAKGYSLKSASREEASTAVRH